MTSLGIELVACSIVPEPTMLQHAPQILYTAELIIHTSLLSLNVLVYWPSSGCFAFIVRTAVVRYILANVQLVNLHVKQKFVDNYMDYI
jgi:hypothetical protein